MNHFIIIWGFLTLLQLSEYQYVMSIRSDLCRNSRRFGQTFLCNLPKFNLRYVLKQNMKGKTNGDLNVMQSQTTNDWIDNNEIRFGDNPFMLNEEIMPVFGHHIISHPQPTHQISNYRRPQTSTVNIHDFYDVNDDFSSLEQEGSVDGYKTLIEIPLHGKERMPTGRVVEPSHGYHDHEVPIRDNLGAAISVVPTYRDQRIPNTFKSGNSFPRRQFTFSTTPWKPMQPNHQKINNYLKQTSKPKRPEYSVIPQTNNYIMSHLKENVDNDKDLEVKEQKTEDQRIVSSYIINETSDSRDRMQSMKDWSLKMSKKKNDRLPEVERVVSSSAIPYEANLKNISDDLPQETYEKSLENNSNSKLTNESKTSENSKQEEGFTSSDKDNNEEFSNFENQVLGKPGVDYPTHSSTTLSDFKCAQPGFFADSQFGCQVYHHCADHDYHQKFICPNGTLFNDRIKSCDFWYNVECVQTTNGFQPYLPQSFIRFESKSDDSRVLEDIKNYIKNLNK